MSPKPCPYASRGWLMVILVIALVDLFPIRRPECPRHHTHRMTLSKGYEALLLHRRKRWLAMGIWTLVTAHLHGLFFPRWMRRIDPISALARALSSPSTELAGG